MYARLITLTAAALLLAFPAFAAAPTSGVVKQAAANIRAVNHRLHHRLARARFEMGTRGDQEVRALNALEAAGYRQFDNLHGLGRDLAGIAIKFGKTYDVTVMPTGQIEARTA